MEELSKIVGQAQRAADKIQPIKHNKSNPNLTEIIEEKIEVRQVKGLDDYEFSSDSDGE